MDERKCNPPRPRKKQKHPFPSRVKKAFQGVDIKKLARFLGSTDNTLSQIVNGLIVVSPLRALQIEELTGGKVKAKVLRPDVFSRHEVADTKY